MSKFKMSNRREKNTLSPKLIYYLSKLCTFREIIQYLKFKCKKSNSDNNQIKNWKLLKFITQILSLKFRYFEDLSKL